MRENIIQFFSESAIGSTLMIIPLFAKDVGATDIQLGMIGCIYGVSLFFSMYYFGRAGDIHNRKTLLQLGLLLSAVVFILHIFVVSPLTLGIIRCFVGFVIGIYPSSLIAHVYESKKSIGKFIGFHALGWVVGCFIAGIIAVYNEIFILSSILFCIAFFLSLKIDLPNTQHTQLKVDFFPIKIIKRSFEMYLSLFFRHLGASAVWIIFPLYVVALGGSIFWLGILYGINFIAQFIIMQTIDRYNSKSLVYVGLLGSGATFILFSQAKNFYYLIPSMILLGIAWSCLYIGGLKYVMERNPEHSTSTGILKSSLPFSGIFGPLIGGMISEKLGYHYVLYFATI